ncbi:thermonuclease family protein [Caviibacterium pharyngocola]|uniref:TNase-like domain-containing protein n=1 Tax=Caviibacterium pharyngocola TaxID=28159 RepID=A0A2M8RUW1_9PAST|nr:thermonuclease family protein [Caviibacterium pharyngocola]PJG82667.1 hypothetical protein CVP04_07635 [Caviibacterium pharyngocola]
MYKKVSFALFVYLLGSLPAYGQNDITCYVVAISDGDTFTCLSAEKTQLKIRLEEIDAPEKNQPFGTQSRRYLGKLIHNKQIHLTTSGYDRYHRILATAYNSEGLNINLQMVRAGMAWAYTPYVRNPVYFTAQKNAQRRQAGLWQSPNPIPPSQWRHKKPSFNGREK